MLLTKTQLQFVAQFASENDTRYILNGVKIEKDKLVATDGHRLAIVPTSQNATMKDYPVVPGMTSSDATLEDCIIPKRFCQDLGKAIPKNKTTMPILSHVAIDTEATNKNGTMEAYTTDLETHQKHSSRKMEGQFPDYTKVIPKEEAIVFSAAFDANYLMELGRAYKQAGIRQVVCEFTKTGILQTKGTLEGAEYRTVLMPVKGGKGLHVAQPQPAPDDVATT